MKVTNLKFGYEVKDVDYSSKKDAKEIVQLIGDGRFVIVKNPKFVEPKTISELYNNMGVVGYQNDEVESAGVGKANGLTTYKGENKSENLFEFGQTLCLLEIQKMDMNLLGITMGQINTRQIKWLLCI